MKSLPRLFAALVLSISALGVLAGCSGMKPPGGKTLSSIAVTPASPAHLKVGSAQQFTATGTFSDGSMSDISSSVTWASGTTATATISAAGLATGVAAGTSSITASQGTVTSPGVTLTVIALQSIAVTPNPASVAIGSTVQFTAKGTYTDASVSDITAQVMWSSLPLATATIGANTGLATGVANGTAQITATLGAIVSPSVTLTVGIGGPPVPIAVVIVQTNPTIPVGGTEDFTAQFLMSDGTLVPPTAAVTWSSGTPAHASIIATSGIALGLVADPAVTITAASTGLASGTTMLNVKAAVSRFAYVSGQNDIASASYVVNSAANTLTPFGVIRDITTKPEQIVPEPSGRFAYGIGTNNFGSIATYSVDPVTGVLTNTGLSFSAGVSVPGPLQAIVDPTGRFLYIANSSTNNVTALQINTTDGSLSCLGSPAPGPPCTTYTDGTLNFPVGVTEDGLGKFVYVTDGGGDDLVHGFSVNADGSLAKLVPTSSFATGSLPGFAAIEPTNTYLYVPNSGANTITGFKINADGSLSEVTAAGSPFTVGSASSNPTMVVVHPSGKFLYVTASGDNKVYGFSVNASTGALTALAGAGSSLPTGNFPNGLAMDPGGSFVIAANLGDNTLNYFAVNSASGLLTAGGTTEGRAVPQFVNIASGVAAPTIAVATVEAANTGNGVGTGSVSSYTTDPTTGALTAAASSPKTTLDGNNQAAVSTSGKFFYTASSSGKMLQGFSLDGSAGLTALPNLPTALAPAVPGGIYAEIADQFVYVADTANAAVLAFNTDPVAGITSNNSATGLTSVQGIAGDPQGQLIYAFGSGQIQPVLINRANGNVVAGITFTQAGNWTAGAIDPSGRFLVAADSTGHQISSFSIQPVTGSTSGGCNPAPPNPPQDGCLTLVPSSTIAVGTGLSGPYAVTFDPLGRFVFVADQVAGSVAVFTFDSSTGLTAPAAAVVVDATNGITNVAVDANGKFLYVGTKGNGTSTSGTVAVYTINSSGTLTPGTPVNAAIGTSAVTVTNSVN
jgi:6-phosphogluconolactonase (cycloisomerase 2 family)